MRKAIRALTVSLALGLFTLASCVELTGQRITLRYDEKRDEIQILIAHDGIHESARSPGQSDEGPEQIPEYVANGNILLVDWVGHVQMKEVRRTANNTEEPPALRALCAAAVASIQSTAVGHYRDPDGHVGALQLVVISKAREFIARINAAISEQVLRSPSEGKSTWPRTRERMQQGASQGKAWLTLEGHSLRFSFPAHPSEWAVNKAAAVKMLVDGWQEAREGKNGDMRPEFFLQILALSPFSIEESSDEVSIRLGNPKRPVPIRFALRDAYNAKLESIVSANATSDLDSALARQLTTDGKEKAGIGAEALLEWGPPEDAVRALLPLVDSKDTAKREASMTRLRSMAREWNRAGSSPAAPEPAENAAFYVESWRNWYRAVLVGTP